MKTQIRKCPKCETYTLKFVCSECGADTVSPHPPPFSPSDKYARYRSQIVFSGDDNQITREA
ncbi:MAG: RNA-protein complex protein Nop10 [archaeon]